MAANDWAKAEMVSSIFFMLFGLSYILASIGFWQFGNTQLSKALIFPVLIAGALLFSAGISFYLSSKSMQTTFETEYTANPSALIKSEIERTKKTMSTYKNVALKVFPAIVVLAFCVSILISNPLVRAISNAVIAFLVVLIVLDSQALNRMKTYNQKLELVEKDIEN